MICGHTQVHIMWLLINISCMWNLVCIRSKVLCQRVDLKWFVLKRQIKNNRMNQRWCPVETDLAELKMVSSSWWGSWASVLHKDDNLLLLNRANRGKGWVRDRGTDGDREIKTWQGKKCMGGSWMKGCNRLHSLWMFSRSIHGWMQRGLVDGWGEKKRGKERKIKSLEGW